MRIPRQVSFIQMFEEGNICGIVGPLTVGKYVIKSETEYEVTIYLPKVSEPHIMKSKDAAEKYIRQHFKTLMTEITIDYDPWCTEHH